MSTVYILWLRQIKKYFRSKSRIVGSLGQPILFLITFAFGFGPIFERAGGGSYLQFIAPGIILMNVLFTSVASGMNLLWDKQFGFLKETLVAPVSRFEIMFGKTLGGATVATMQGIIIFFLTLLIGFRPENITLLPVALLLIFLVSLLFTSLGMIVASILENMQGFQLIINFIVTPTFFLSGALYSLKETPIFIKVISNFNPLTYGVDALRGLLINVTYFGVVNDFFILTTLTIFLLMVGSYLFERIHA